MSAVSLSLPEPETGKGGRAHQAVTGPLSCEVLLLLGSQGAGIARVCIGGEQYNVGLEQQNGLAQRLKVSSALSLGGRKQRADINSPSSHGLRGKYHK